MNTGNKDFCVILAGGKGRRLWPVSREEYPKQFIDFFGTGKTMLQSTVDRVCKIIPKENIYICTCKEYLALVQEQRNSMSFALIMCIHFTDYSFSNQTISYLNVLVHSTA